MLGDDHPNTLISINNLAGLYWSQGRYAEAEPLFLETLETQKRVLGNDHPDTLTSMNNLGGLYIKLRRYDQAAALLEDSLAARIRVLGDDHLHVGYSYYNLGCLSASLGRSGEALDHLHRAVDLGWQERDIFTDTALDSLRGDPAFEAIVAEVRQRTGAK